MESTLSGLSLHLSWPKSAHSPEQGGALPTPVSML